MEAPTVRRDAVASSGRPGVLRTGATLTVFAAVIVASWALVIAVVWALLQVLT
jgi:hypothetical protein